MNLKEKFETHSVIFCATLAVGSFITGLTVYPSLHSDNALRETTKPSIECKLDGIDAISDAHNKRITVLQEGLLRQEEKSTDPSLITSYQDEAKDSAERIRKDIDSENRFFNASLNTLMSKCIAASSKNPH